MELPPDYDSRWEKIWKGGPEGTLQKGSAFDATGSSPALIHLLSSGGIGDLANKRVFVPGCGRGYDLVTFVQSGAQEAVGLELSETAVACAKEYLSEANCKDSAKISVIQGDFFKWDSGEKFDVGYDYTFFCAMHPSMRSAVGEAWARHIKPGGLLVTLIFPVDEDRDREGPPWPVWPDLYKEIFLAHGFVLRTLEAVAGDYSHKGREGREWMAVWERKEE